MKRVKTTIFVLFTMAIFSSSLFANGLSLNSIGTRAMGMGGAFVGLADDGTALYWNPAGLAGLKSSVYVFGADIIPSATYKYGTIDATMKTNHYISPNIFFNYTSGDMAFALGIYVPAGLGAEWDPAELGYPASANLELMSKIGVINFSPGFAYQVSDAFSVGIAVNIYYAMFDMKQPVMQDVNGDGVPEFFQFSEESTGLGFGGTIGLKYNFSDAFSAGATFRLATKVTMNGTAKNPMFPALPNMPPAVAPGPEESEFDRDVTWPMWIAGGFAYKASDAFTLAFDVQYSQWSELTELETIYKDAYWLAAMAGQNKMTLEWKDAIQIRVGGEYDFSKAVTGRLGYYYDPAPAPDETVNILFPSSTNHVATGGLTYRGSGFYIEGAAEYLIGAERDIAPAPDNMPGKHQMNIFAFNLAAGICL